MNNETKKHLSDAIEYFHAHGMKENLSGDSKYYVEHLLNAAATQLGIELV